MEKRSNGIGVTGFVLSLVTIIVCFIPYVAWISWLTLILAFIFSLIGVCKKNASKGLAITGLIISSILLLLGIIALCAGAAILASL